MAFLLSFAAGASTMLGCLFIFFKDRKNVILKYSLAFASGVMICVSIIDLIPESLSFLYNGNKNLAFIKSLFFIMIGMCFSFFIDKLIPEYEPDSNGIFKIGVFSMLAIMMHNLPEGIATFLSSNSNMKLGLSITAAIALHNIPEGISISVPIFKATGSRFKALIYTFISGMSEPFGALIAFLFLGPFINDYIMGMLLSVIAGLMIHIGAIKLLPASFKYENKGRIFMFFVFGFIFMIISHLIMK